MVKHFTRADLIAAIQQAVLGGPYTCSTLGHGRAGNLLEEVLGIDGGNYDVADAVGFELKTTLSPNTPTTLFHKDPKPRGKRGTPGAVAILLDRFGWQGTYGEDEAPIKSFRATMWGKWTSRHTKEELLISANEDKVSITHNGKEYAYWDSNDLVGAASAKLRNMMFVEAKENQDKTISFVNAYLFEDFQPFRFLKAIESGHVAIDFDARTNPNKAAIRNHGTKFRIRERDFMMIYAKIMPIEKLLSK
jgi:MvaI/BcnI restriction endonuclease family